MRRNHPSATLLNVLINKKITKTTNKTMGNSTTKKGNFVAIIAMIFLFAMIAFVTNLCSPMAVILKNNFSVSDTLAQVGNYGNFGAYFLMGIPAGLLIQKFGYKKTALLALIVGIVGLLIQWLSGSMGFVVYLIGAFISGLCMCMLNTVVNPMLNLLGGGGNTGNQLVQIGGVFNSAAAV
jgi:FHS family L-fucose permease-like MFS transporter